MAPISYLNRLSVSLGWNIPLNASTASAEYHCKIGEGEGLTAAGNLTLGAGLEAELAANATLVLGGGNGTHGGDWMPPNEIRDTLWIVVPMTIIYSIIFVVGVLGNVVTCVVISRNKSMHTATNYYLFSLAVSDLVLLVTGIPQEIYFYWFRYPYPFNLGICVFANFLAETSANATVLTITAFTVERYFAICRPFLSHTVARLSRAVRFIMVIWVMAVCLAVPQSLAVHIDKRYKTCTVRHDQAKPLFFVSSVLVFILPMGIITVLYLLIWLKLRRSDLVRSSSKFGSSIRLKRFTRRRGSQRTVVTLQNERTGSISSPGHGSKSPLTKPTVQPAPSDAPQQSPNLSPDVNLSPPQGAISCPSTPETGSWLSRRHRRARKMQQRRAAVSSPASTVSLEVQSFGPSDEGRIHYFNRAQSHSTRHVVKMLVAVVIAFFLCWAPFHAQRLMAVYANEHNQNATVRKTFELLTYTSGILYYVSTCINPMLYNIMSRKFRVAFQEMVANHCNLGPTHPLREDLFFRNVSLHSTAHNSRTLNTCSTIRLGESVVGQDGWGGAAGEADGGVGGAGGAAEGGAGSGISMSGQLRQQRLRIRRRSRRPSAYGIPLVRLPLRRTSSEETAEPAPVGPEVAGVEPWKPGPPDLVITDLQPAEPDEARPQRYEPGCSGVPEATATPGDANEPADGPPELAPADLCSIGQNAPTPVPAGSGRRSRTRVRFGSNRTPGAAVCLQPTRLHVCRFDLFPEVRAVRPTTLAVGATMRRSRPPLGRLAVDGGTNRITVPRMKLSSTETETETEIELSEPPSAANLRANGGQRHEKAPSCAACKQTEV